jgi:hypothetical protein
MILRTHTFHFHSYLLKELKSEGIGIPLDKNKGLHGDLSGPCRTNNNSASSRISKGHGYQSFLRKRAGSSFGQKMPRRSTKLCILNIVKVNKYEPPGSLKILWMVPDKMSGKVEMATDI